ncbi:MAG: hypothetical protein ATN35_09020 [Epulopiscium sp. Nele67-Bin004]|nr:MAG: hypothetical protein ATN35_09020 [Epulopiscium sp. Nele67-Bin004]
MDKLQELLNSQSDEDYVKIEFLKQVLQLLDTSCENNVSERYEEVLQKQKDEIQKLMVENDQLKKEIGDLSTQIEAKEAQSVEFDLLATQDDTLNTLQKEVSDLEQDVNSFKERAREKSVELSYYTERYSKIEDLSLKFKQLSPTSTESIKNIFKELTSPIQLLITIGDYEKLKILWEYVVYLYINSDSHAEEINELFDLCFELYQEVYPHFERVDVEVGATFSTDEHIRVGQASRQVVEVKFRGIKNSRNGKYVQKSVVLT